jgi:hypothetical protein
MKLFNPINLIPPQYKLAAYIVAAILIVGALFGGGYKTGHTFATNHYTAIIADMEATAAKLEADKAKLQGDLEKEIANVKIKVITKYVDRIKVIKEKEYVYRDQAINVVPDRSILSNGWVSVHDAAAAGNPDADSTRAADGSPSGVAANQALARVTENYSACHANAEQLTALQEYVREVQKVVDKANETIRKYNEKN